MRNNFSQPPPMRFPPTQYSIPTPNFPQQQYLASPCIGGSYDQNVSTSVRPSVPLNFMPSHTLPMTHFPLTSPSMEMNFNNPPPQIRPQGETSNKPITNSNLNSDSRQHAISGQSHNRSGQIHNSSSGNQSNFPYQYPYASHGSRGHKSKNEDGRRSSDSREKRNNDVGYRRDSYSSVDINMSNMDRMGVQNAQLIVPPSRYFSPMPMPQPGLGTSLPAQPFIGRPSYT